MMRYIKKFPSLMESDNMFKDYDNFFGTRIGDIVIFNDLFITLTKGNRYKVVEVMDNNYNDKDEVDKFGDIITVIDDNGKEVHMYANRFLKEYIVDANKYNL